MFAERVAPFVLRGAARVVVPNEFLRDEYRQRYGVEPVVIHNPSDPPEPDIAAPWPADPGEIKIVYTGAVYQAHYDAFRNLLEAIDLLGRPDLKLHVYTAQPPGELEREGISGPMMYHGHLPLSTALGVQRRADILFLPLAFNSSFPEGIVRTSAPGKMGEYLAGGRPILAHAPGDSFVSWYFRTYQVGSLVDHPDPLALAHAIQQIIDEPDLRRRWCENALARARTDFSLETARRRFLELFQTTH
jgi:glycosyltransferase involved in cell wall biosynthesis